MNQYFNCVSQQIKYTVNAHFVYPIYYMKTQIVPHRCTIQNFGQYPHEIYDLFHQGVLYGYCPLEYMIINITFKKSCNKCRINGFPLKECSHNVPGQTKCAFTVDQNVPKLPYKIANNAYSQHRLVYSYSTLNQKPYEQINLKI